MLVFGVIRWLDLGRSEAIGVAAMDRLGFTDLAFGGKNGYLR